MNQSKFDLIYKHLTGIARKVFEAVPQSEAWSVMEVLAELKRLGHSSCSDLRVVHGCLASLVDSGVIVEGPRGKFKKITVKAKEEMAAAPYTPVIQVQMPATPEAQPLDRLASIASRVRQAAAVLTDVANDIDAAALDVAERSQRTDQETSKLLQLKQILKEIGA